MKNIVIILIILFLKVCSSSGALQKESLNKTSLKEASDNKFFVGAALGVGFENDPKKTKLVKHQFNSIVPENCMKSGEIQPKEGEFFWDNADKFVAFGEANNMHIIGHCLVWHSQTPVWLFTDANGNDVSREVLIQRMKDHIFAVVGRYKGRVHGWDVVNEALLDDGSYRQSKWFNIIGEDFIELAFQFAHEADPEAELYYNDYSLNNPAKRDGAVRLIKKLQNKGIKINAIGMQAHYRLDFSPEQFEASIKSFSETGVKVMITELDLSVLPWTRGNASANIADKEAYRKKYDPYVAGLPDSIATKQAEIYSDLFKILIKHNEVVSRVTFWGTNDGDSWKNNFPVKGRTDYPLLFDRDYQAKPAYYAVMKLLTEDRSADNETVNYKDLEGKAIAQPLVKHIYTADPSAHVFNGKIYIYPSHDIDAGEAFDDLGSHFDMKDYHVISMDNIDSEATDNGVALHVDDVPWAEKQMWAPDANEKNGTYYLYFPAKDDKGIFRIGVATGSSPVGPYTAQPEAIKGSFSIDPAVFKDDDGNYYMYFGGIWGGQLQRWRTGKYNQNQPESPTAFLPKDKEAALLPQVAKMTDDLLEFAETPKGIEIVDENGNLLLAGDTERRFFEASWMHKYQGKYYFSYSTGDTHKVCYATGDSPYGPFTYQGVVLNPVVGWTTHHSIVEISGKWYLFYHDCILSEGVTHLRTVKFHELKHRTDGSIETLDPIRK